MEEKPVNALGKSDVGDTSCIVREEVYVRSKNECVYRFAVLWQNYTAHKAQCPTNMEHSSLTLVDSLGFNGTFSTIRPHCAPVKKITVLLKWWYSNGFSAEIYAKVHSGLLSESRSAALTVAQWEPVKGSDSSVAGMNLALQVQLVVSVSAFVLVSTVFVSFLLAVLLLTVPSVPRHL